MKDLLFVNCRVLTMDPNRPRAEAALLRGDRVLAVAGRSELQALLCPDAHVVDADGAVIMPAFHDSHVHLGQHGFELGQIDLHGAESLDEGLSRIAERADEEPEGSWLLGAGFALQRWGVTSLGKEMLDRVAPRHPVLMRSQDHHSAWVNSEALRRSGVGAQTIDPENGTVVRDEQGEPTGLLLERALHLVWDRLPTPGPDDIATAVRRAGVDLASRGIATVHHMAYEPAAYWREVAGSASEEDFPVRVWACVNQEEIEGALAIGLATGQGGGNFMIGGAKFFADGALGSRTAWMLEPYEGTSNYGVAVHGPQVLAERYPLAIAAGLTPVTHAIGDAAVRAVLDALEETAPAWRARRLRPRIEHAQHVSRQDLARFGELGVVASIQPGHLTFDIPSIEALLSLREERAFPISSLLESGTVVAFGSDTPVASPDVFAGLRAACRRAGQHGRVLGAEQALTAEQALACYTRGAARAIGREGRSGMLRPGFDADLVLLSHDPLDSLDGLTVRGTLKGGRPTFDPEGLLSPGYTPA